MYYSIPFIKPKKECNVRIGFHDAGLMLVMIPVLAFFIPIVFFGVRFHKPVYYTWDIYLHTLLTTAVVWTGNRYIMIGARKRYPDFGEVRKRLMVQSGLMLVYTFVATNLLSILLKNFCNLGEATIAGQTLGDMLLMPTALHFFAASPLPPFTKANIL
jgi:hypothetical protein